VSRAGAGAPTGPDVGVYVHIPFCHRRCDYCSFAAWDDRADQVGAYMTALAADVVAVADGLSRPVTSVFVGGGTPSLVPGADLAGVLAPIPLADGAEVTVEVNPEDADPGLFECYRAAGVNRVSFGVQSMSAHVLDALGRRHRPEAVPRAVALARQAGFTSFNLDVIYGAAGETVDDWRHTVDTIMELDPPHISAYALTVEAGTPLAGDVARHPDDDDQAEKYLVADESFAAAGLDWYEISNWSRPGHECRHNQLYWSQGEYLGVGCSAHSHREGRRWWNLRTPERYQAAVAAGTDPVAGEEHLDAPQQRLEALQLGIRTRHGVPVGAIDPVDAAGVLDGLIERHGDRWVLSRRGRLLANEVAVRLV
jgi:putative oxygen-independent coproporphyrinogen III oxidase